MKRLIAVLILFLSVTVSAQTSEKYNSEYAPFFRAEELFQKQQYAAARIEFRNFMVGFNHPEDPMFVKARY
jgi:hypothetical protein